MDSLQEEREENIKVCVRFRPLNAREKRLGNATKQGENEEPWSWDRHSVKALFPITRGERSRQRAIERYGENAATGRAQPEPSEFLFDRVFGTEESTEELYDEVMQGLVVSSMEGKHCAAFAFGQTSTGKTYTMQGTSEFPGIIPRAIHDVFSYVNQATDREFLLRVSYIEVYNESINDLFEPLSSNLKVFEDPKRGPQIQGLEEKIVVTPEQLFALISAGEAQRHIGSTDYNKQSSRSHTIFRLVIESKVKEAEDAELTSSPGQKRSPRPARVATLNLVDLAGSESAQSSEDKTRRQEGSHINKSLLTLTHVIYKLSERASRGRDASSVHIPYRDSKLTRILQKSLQGNSRISIVCTATPWAGATEETLNTLRFASRAKKVKRSVYTNEIMDERALLLKYKQEIAELRLKLAEAEKKSQIMSTQVAAATAAAAAKTGPDSALEDYEEQKKRDSKMRAQIDEAIRNLNRVILNSSSEVGHSRKDSGEMEDSSSVWDNESHHVIGTAPSTPLASKQEQVQVPSSGLIPEMSDNSTPFFRKLSSIDHDLDKYNRTFLFPETKFRRSLSTSEILSPAVLQGIGDGFSFHSRRKSLDDGTPILSRNSNGLTADSPPTTPRKKLFQDTASLSPQSERGSIILGSPSRGESTPKQSSTRPPPVPSPRTPAKRSSITRELKSIRMQLSNLLDDADIVRSDIQPKTGATKIAESASPISKPSFPSKELPASTEASQLPSKEYVKALEQRVKELEQQVMKYDLEQSVSKADRSFLENLLAEKDRTIQEWGQVIEEIEAKQLQLESENERLRVLVARYESRP